MKFITELRLVALPIGLVLGLGFFGLSLPDRVHVERTVVVEASPAAVYAVLNNLQTFSQWSPWNGRAGQYRLSGPAAGVGAEVGWDGSDSLAAGRLRIVRSVQAQVQTNSTSDPADAEGASGSAIIELDFAVAGREAVSYFKVDPSRDRTRVIWATDIPLRGALDRLWGHLRKAQWREDTESGLSKLKVLVEAQKGKSELGLASR